MAFLDYRGVFEMEKFIAPILIVVGIGLIAGIILTLAAKFMAVKVDERVAKLREALPGANCGACGYPGCDEYAKVLAEDHTIKANLCTPGGSAVSQEISEILGVEFEGVAGKVAILKCSGSCEKTNYVMDYQGLQSCRASKQFYRGRGACHKSCLGFGDCAVICEYDAIKIENGIAVVDRNKCIGCGMCEKSCPNKLIEIVPKSTRVVVGCSSEESPTFTRQNCKIGCIGCKLCVKACKFDAIEVDGSLATIDYTKCKNCTLCAKVCPRGVIKVLPKRT